jgi:hypothetical protein
VNVKLLFTGSASERKPTPFLGSYIKFFPKMTLLKTWEINAEGKHENLGERTEGR